MKIKQMMSRKVFRTFWVSFLLVYVLPLCLLVMLELQMFNVMEQDLNTQSRLSLEQYRAETDGQLYALMRGGDSMMVNEKVIYFSTIGNPLEYTVNIGCFTMLRSLMRDVSALSVSNDEIESAYIYFRESDSVVGSSFMTADMYYRRVLKDSFQNYEQWKAFLNMRANGFVLRPGDTLRRSVSYMRTSRRGDVTLVLEMKASALSSRVAALLPTYSATAIYDKEYKLLYASDEGLPTSAPDELREARDNAGELKINSENNHAVWLTSAATGCHYLNAIPSTMYYASLNRMRLWSCTLLLTLFLGGLYLCYYLAKRRYQPIDELRAQLAPEGTVPRDDFAYLHDMLRGMQSEGASIRQRLKASNQNMEHYVLEQLMRGDYVSVKAMEEQLLSLDIVFESNCFALVGVRIDSLPAPDAPTDNPVDLEESRRLRRFIVHGIFEELLAAYSPLVLEMSNRLYLLITPDRSDDWAAQLEPLIAQGREVLLSHYEMQVSIAVSERTEGMHTISTLYSWCREALSRASAGSDYFAWRSPLQTAVYNHLQQITATTAHKLEQAILAGDEPALNREMDVLNETCRGNSSWSIRMSLTTILSLLMDFFSNRLTTESRRPLDQKLRAFLEAAPSPDDAARMRKLVLALYGAISATGDGNHTADLATRAQRYITRHHTESSLNVSMVADYLDLTPSYASALFKKQTGQSMLDVINLTRIRHAKQLLAQGRLSMEDISEQVGYYNASTFIRVFKKYEGLTPGQYRAASGHADD